MHFPIGGECVTYRGSKLTNSLGGANSVGVFHLQKISENSFWEFPSGKSAFHLSQVPFEGAEGGLAA